MHVHAYVRRVRRVCVCVCRIRGRIQIDHVLPDHTHRGNIRIVHARQSCGVLCFALMWSCEEVSQFNMMPTIYLNVAARTYEKSVPSTLEMK